MKYLGKTQPHPVLKIEITTWELERILESLEGRKDTPALQERRDLIRDIERLLVTANEPR